MPQVSNWREIEFEREGNGIGVLVDTSERSCGESRTQYTSIGWMTYKEAVQLRDILDKLIEQIKRDTLIQLYENDKTNLSSVDIDTAKKMVKYINEQLGSLGEKV